MQMLEVSVPLCPLQSHSSPALALQPFLAWTHFPGLLQILTWGNPSYPRVLSPPHPSGEAAHSDSPFQAPSALCFPCTTPAAPSAVRDLCGCDCHVSHPTGAAGWDVPLQEKAAHIPQAEIASEPWTDEDPPEHSGLNSVFLFLFRSPGGPCTPSVQQQVKCLIPQQMLFLWHQAEPEFWSIKFLISSQWKPKVDGKQEGELEKAHYYRIWIITHKSPRSPLLCSTHSLHKAY